MLTVLHIPTRMTFATSLAVTFVSSIGGSVGKLVTGQVDYLPVVIMSIASLLAASLGAKTGKKMNTKVIKGVLALMIAGTAIKIWIDLLS